MAYVLRMVPSSLDVPVILRCVGGRGHIQKFSSVCYYVKIVRLYFVLLFFFLYFNRHLIFRRKIACEK